MAVPEFTPEELESEEWRQIPGYEGLYSVSNLGRIRRDKGGRGTSKATNIRRPSKTVWGYLTAHLSRDNVVNVFSVHRLVMLCFKGERPSGLQINHKNGIKIDNRLGNLEYVTPSANHLHAHRMGLKPTGSDHPFSRRPKHLVQGEGNGNAHLTSEQVRKIRELRNAGHSQRAVARRFGVGQGTVSRIMLGHSWSHLT